MKIKNTFKVISILLIYLCFLNHSTTATVFTVNVSNFQFSPANIPNVVVGDVIRWEWVAGSFDHTTTCDPSTQSGTSLPPGAATWNSTLNAANPVFEYTVTVAGVYNYWCIPHAPGMAASFTASAAVPVKLSEFKISNQNNNAVLNWTTALEDNIDYFSIQKSKTGADFVEIAKVPAFGNSSVTRSYNYTDPNSSLSDKYYYYTIAIVDKEGKKEFSPVELFKNKINISKLIISLSPNPVSRSGHLMLKFNADKKSKMDVKILNIEGRSVIETTMDANEGVNNGHLMLGNISPGSYSASFELNGIKEVYKLVVN